MALAPANTDQRLAVRPFDDRDAGSVVGWVESAADLRWLAPSTEWPLTVQKVRAWRREEGKAFGLYLDGGAQPIGYGELNPMRANPAQLWLGHVIVSPAHQRCGFGRWFVAELSRVAFEDHHANRLILVVFPANTPALQCYQRAGFRTVGEEFHLLGNPFSEKPRRRHRLVRLELEPGDCHSS